MDPGTLALVTTVRDPGASFESFLRYHLAIGIAQIIVFCDDPQDPAIAVARAFGPAVTVIAADETLRRRYPTLQSYQGREALVDRSHNVRQVLNAEIAIGMAMEMGHRWLLHLDADELFFSPVGTLAQHLGDLDRDGIDVAMYHNLEAVPTSRTVTDPFREVHLFKINPQRLPHWQLKAVTEFWLPLHGHFFTGYVNGKALVRLRPGVLPYGRHCFRPLPDHDRHAKFLRPMVLHYAHCGLEVYTTKMARLATTPEVETVGLPFYAESIAAWKAGGAEALQALYDRSVMVESGDRLLQHLGDQTIGKFHGPSRILAAADAKAKAGITP